MSCFFFASSLMLSWLIFQVHCDEGSQQSDVKKLRDYLFNPNKYDPKILPLPPPGSSSIRVDMTFTLKNIVYLDPETQFIRLNAYKCLTWYDVQLKWNPSEFGDLDSIHVYSSKLWLPDVQLYNKAYSLWTFFNEPVTIKSDGNVTWCHHERVFATCTMDLTNFPLDEHNCTLSYGSWTYSDEDLPLFGHAISEYRDTNPEWSLTSVTSSRKVNYYGDMEVGFPVVSIYVLVKRRTDNYFYTVVLPSAAVALLTLLIFWVPPNSYKKITLACVNALILLWLMKFVFDVVKGSERVPRMIKYLGNVFLVEGIAVMLSTIVLNLSDSSMPFAPPEALSSLLHNDLVGKILFLCPLSIPSADAMTGKPNQGKGELVRRKREWFLIAQSIDRISFIVFAVVLCVVHL